MVFSEMSFNPLPITSASRTVQVYGLMGGDIFTKDKILPDQIRPHASIPYEYPLSALLVGNSGLPSKSAVQSLNATVS